MWGSEMAGARGSGVSSDQYPVILSRRRHQNTGMMLRPAPTGYIMRMKFSGFSTVEGVWFIKQSLQLKAIGR